MSNSINTAAFINQATNQQLKKKYGGMAIVWTADETKEMEKIAHSVRIGDFSIAQAVKLYREARAQNKTLGTIRANKSPTAFKKQLSKVIRKLEECDKEKTD